MLHPEIKERCDRIRTLYRTEPCFKYNLYYQRVWKQRLNYMRAFTSNDPRAYTTRLRRAYAEAYLLDHMEPVIHEDELIVGLPDYTPLTPSEEEEYSHLEYAMKGNLDTGTETIGHMALDYPKLLRLGISGMLDEIREYRSKLDLNNPGDLPKEEFYEGCMAELEALVRLQYRYRDHARRLAENISGRRKKELEQIAENLSHVPAEPARTFHEALQSIHFYNFTLWELYYFGRVDQYLLDYYRKDVANGILSYDRAVELFACFLLLPEAYIMPNVALDSFIGGTDPQGNVVENEVTNIALDAVAYARTANGKVALAISPKTSDSILRKAIRLNAEGLLQPALYNDETIVKGFLKAGLPPEHARDYANTGCVEMTPIGRSGMYVVAPYHNLPAYMMETLHEHAGVGSMEELYPLFLEKIRDKVFTENLAINQRQMERSRNGCEVLRSSCLVHDCIAKGKAIDEGGAQYNFIEPNFVGLANTIDSLIAVDYLVFREHRFTLREFLSILEENYDGNEVLRQYIIHKLPHFGTNETSTDQMAIRLTDMILEACKGIRTYRGSTLIPGAFSYLEHANFGLVTGATPDGRLSGYPLSSGSSPTQGREVEGPTAAMLSTTCWNHEAYIGGITVNMKFTPGQMSGEAEERMLTFIKTFMDRGGMQMQFNCVSKDTLLKAREHPEEYGDLLVRVGGFSAYFCKLNPQLQQEVIDRNEHAF